MRLVVLLGIFGLFLAGIAMASVIPEHLTEQKCGNKIREGYELCEPDTPYDICPAIGKLLKIAMVCNEVNCACLPGESAKDCGNQIREGVEMCDPGTKEPAVDFCSNITSAIGLPLKCDEKTCDCVPAGLPVVLSTCGDEKIEGNEDCEGDEDCPKGRVCDNCSCVRKDAEIELSPVQYNVTTDNVSVPTIEEIIAQRKNTVLGFVLEDYVGEVIPEELEYFDDEKINIHVALNDGTNTTVSVITTEMVIQEIHNYALNKTTMDVWVDEADAEKIRAGEERTPTIALMLENGEIEYRPRGFFRRIWFFLFTPF
jgi:hypothetical protein